jgi:hypothetical protein
MILYKNDIMCIAECNDCETCPVGISIVKNDCATVNKDILPKDSYVAILSKKDALDVAEALIKYVRKNI